MSIPINDLKRGFQLYQNEYEEKVLEILRKGSYILSNEVDHFEKEFAEAIGPKYGIGVDNGLDAILLGLKALGIGNGDEVIVQANTYIATVLGVTLNGAKPVFVEPTIYHNLDPDRIEEKITNRTKAVLVTHLYGQASEMARIQEICEKNNIFLLEDCAQSHFAEYYGKKTGSFGKMGFFSFYPTKNLGGFGDGGAILTDDINIAKILKALRNYGSIKRYENDIEGYNARLDEVQAGLLRVKLRHLREITKERQKIAGRYLNEIRNPKIDLPMTAEGCSHVYHLFVLQTDERDKFREYLKEAGVSTDIHYPTPPYLAKAYQAMGYQYGDFPITEGLYRRIVTIPLFNGMLEEEIDTVIRAVNQYE